MTATPTLAELERCFGGAIPAVFATASADGVANVTYVSRAHQVDDQRIALSNQFMSKTARNLAANPRGCLLLMDPITHDEYRLTLVYERTERRGHVFERLRSDVDALAALEGMQDVYRLRAADIFRVLEIEQLPPNPSGVLPAHLPPRRAPSPELAALAELSRTLARAGDLDVLVDAALDGLDRLLGYPHVHLLLVDETGRRLYTIASHGFDTDSVGAEIAVGAGLIGMAAERCDVIRIGSHSQMAKYSRSIRRGYESSGVRPGHEVPVPDLDGVQSLIVVPALALGQLVGVLAVESRHPAAFSVADEHVLQVVASQLAQAVEHLRALEGDEADVMPPAPPEPPPVASPAPAAGTAKRVATVRFFGVDGSVFVDDEYLIKGVAGRILWSLAEQHAAGGRVDFTNRELRLDPTLELPPYKDNLESRLLLLKRRLDERQAPIRIHKTARGRFRLQVDGPLQLTRS